jgi:hypothetical protein
MIFGCDALQAKEMVKNLSSPPQRLEGVVEKTSFTARLKRLRKNVLRTRNIETRRLKPNPFSDLRYA